eukprot:scaffold85792_cov62-Phaeocystis_antarctica.AAC.3
MPLTPKSGVEGSGKIPGRVAPRISPRCGVLAMMIRPCKPRDSARPALLTAVGNRRTASPLLPEVNGPAVR